QVELQRLQLDDGRPGHVGDGDRGEVGLARERADAGELRRLAPHLVLPPGMRVGDGDELTGRTAGHRPNVAPVRPERTFRARTRPGPTMGTRPEGRGPTRLLLLAEHPVHLGGADGAGALGGPPTVGQLDLLALELPLFP